MPRTPKSAEDRVIEFFTIAPQADANRILRTVKLILNARGTTAAATPSKFTKSHTKTIKAHDVPVVATGTFGTDN